MGLKSKIDRYIESKIRKVVSEVLQENRHNVKYGLQDLALKETCAWIQDNVSLNKTFEDRFELLSEAVRKIEHEDGLVLEFGVYKGETINHISNKLAEAKLIFGFDSFEGLKEPWIFSNEGGFSDVNGKLPNVPDNVKLVKGYFEDTLPEFLTKNNNPIALLHIDADLYSSSRTILTQLNHLIVKGTVIVFDEFFNYPNWKNGEFKAWNEFVAENEVEYKYLGYTYQRTEKKKSGNQLALKILNKKALQ